MSELATLLAQQQALVARIRQGDSPGPGLRHLPGLRQLPGLAPGAGLLAYQRHAQALSARALAAVFPVLEQVLGATEFAAMAWAFWRQQPPRQGDLACWGAELAAFLARQAGMDLWLCDLARIAWALHEAGRAPDTRLDAHSLTLLQTQEAQDLTLLLRPGLSLLQVAPEALACLGEPPAEAGARLVVWRKGWQARWRQLARGDWAWMQALQAGHNIAWALQQAQAAEPAFDFDSWLQDALGEAWLLAATTHPDKD